MYNYKINVAIDGPAGAGKSTIARLVANSLKYIYVDTGAMYRAVTLKAMQANLKSHQHDEIASLAANLEIVMVPRKEGQQILANGVDITEAIRSQDVNQEVSKIARIEKVRKLLVTKQQNIAASKGVVMDGRDIATHVLPNADVKVYLTASVEERALRRFNEMKDHSVTLEQLEKEITLRDETDKQREISPLVVAEGAVVIDCTHMSISEVVDTILNLCRTKLNREQ